MAGRLHCFTLHSTPEPQEKKKKKKKKKHKTLELTLPQASKLGSVFSYPSQKLNTQTLPISI
jgi:hypothetical protein